MSGANEPLLASSRQHDEDPFSSDDNSDNIQWLKKYHKKCRRLLVSRNKHFLIMAVVTLDVVGLLANIFMKLIACEMHQSDEPWVEQVSSVIETFSLIFSSFFMIELAACLFAFGFAYLKSWFHLFDATVIVVSFIIDVSSQGLTESIGSLVVVLRLWRLAKISEEVILGASERMEVLEQHLDELEAENKHLRTQLGLESQEHSGHD